MNTEKSGTDSSHGGLVALLLKSGLVLLKLLPKVVKTIFSLKAGLAGLSVFYFASVYHSWIVGGMFFFALAIHEYGHIFAMKRCGLRTRGMYFIPGLGGLAISEDEFDSAPHEAFIAIMGPIFGLVFFVLPIFCLYLATDIHLFAGLAGLAAFFNLFNLLPVNPLDGGRMMKTFVHSMHERAGFLIMLCIAVIAGTMAAYYGLGLISFMAAVGVAELVSDYGLSKLLPFTTRILMHIFVWGITVWVALISSTGNLWSLKWFAGCTVATLYVLVIFFVSKVAKLRTAKQMKTAFAEEWRDFRMEDIKRVKNYPALSRKQLILSALSYLVLGAIFISCILFVSRIPQLDVLRGVLQ